MSQLVQRMETPVMAGWGRSNVVVFKEDIEQRGVAVGCL